MQYASHLQHHAIEHSKVDFQKMHEVAKHLHENPEMKEEFAKDPNGYVFKFNGLKVRDGHHLHVADENNNLFPPEEYGVFGAEERSEWGRVEVRVGYKTTSLVDCA